MGHSSYRPLSRTVFDDEPLLHDEHDVTSVPKDPQSSSPAVSGGRRSYHLRVTLFLSLILNAAMIVAGLAFYQATNPSGPATNPLFPQSLYSPAQGVIEYESKVFHEGFGLDRSIYQMPPSPEVDAAWEALYNFGVTRISKSDAERLVNSTYRIPGDEEYYVIQLDVFHQLHCLDILRKGLYPDHYPVIRNASSDIEGLHWSHCLESIRQSLMCSADISPLVWQWVDQLKEVRIMGNIIHTCRNYAKIKEWALERRVQHAPDFTGFM